MRTSRTLFSGKVIFGGFSVVALVALIVVPLIALADNVDYGVPVSSVSPADKGSVTAAGDGTVFVDITAGNTAYPFYFTLNTWAEPDKQRSTYPISAPIVARKLSGEDWSGNTALSLTSGNFNGATNSVTATYSNTGSATKNNVPIYVRFNVPTCSALHNGQNQVKIQADTSGIAHLGNGSGIILRLNCDAMEDTRTPTVVDFPTPTPPAATPTPTPTTAAPTPTPTQPPATPTPTPTPALCYDYNGNTIPCP